MMATDLKIATPVSTIFNATSRLAEILELSDVLEVRELSRPVASEHPRIYHCDWSLIEPWTEEELQEITNVIVNNHPELVTFHLHACYAKPPLEKGKFMPHGEKLTVPEMIAHAKSNISNLRSKLGLLPQLAVENNNYHPTGAYEIVTDGEFINELMNQLDLKLLLDVAHAQISATNKQITLDEYLAGLNLENVVQFHLSHPGPDPENPKLAKDLHEALEEADWKLTKELIGRCPNLKYLTLEYYRKDDQLVLMLKRLKEVIE